jgi:hypothetical protein
MTNLTMSEARAEAVCVVLKLMLNDLRPGRRDALMRAAQQECADIGHPMVMEEIDWLFC